MPVINQGRAANEWHMAQRPLPADTSAYGAPVASDLHKDAIRSR